MHFESTSTMPRTLYGFGCRRRHRLRCTAGDARRWGAAWLGRYAGARQPARRTPCGLLGSRQGDCHRGPSAVGAVSDPGCRLRPPPGSGNYGVIAPVDLRWRSHDGTRIFYVWQSTSSSSTPRRITLLEAAGDRLWMAPARGWPSAGSSPARDTRSSPPEQGARGRTRSRPR